MIFLWCLWFFNDFKGFFYHFSMISIWFYRNHRKILKYHILEKSWKNHKKNHKGKSYDFSDFYDFLWFLGGLWKLADWGGSFLMVYRNNTGRLDFWLHQCVLRNTLAGSKTMVSTSRNPTVLGTIFNSYLWCNVTRTPTVLDIFLFTSRYLAPSFVIYVYN